MATLEENYVAESHVESFWFWLLKFTEDFVYCKVSKQQYVTFIRKITSF
jgi:hypothetical protein